jgi:chromosome partitioning protein
MSKVISFFTQKGGSGSSTLALVLAAPLATEYRLRIAILDCDSQQSIVRTREQFDAHNLDNSRKTDPAATYPYDVFSKTVSEVFDFINTSASNYDLIILDLPRWVNERGVFSVLTACDAVIVPLVSDFQDRASTAEFMGILEGIQAATNEARIPFQHFGLRTKRIANQREEKDMEAFVRDVLGICCFNSYLSNHAAYTRASTLFSLLTLDYRSYAGGSAGTSEEIRRVCAELIERVGLPNRTAPLLSLTARQQHELQQH